MLKDIEDLKEVLFMWALSIIFTILEINIDTFLNVLLIYLKVSTLYFI